MPEVDRGVLLVGLAVVVAVAIGLWYGFGAHPGPPEPPATIVEIAPTTQPEVIVHVTGAVVHPGLVRVTGGARIADVVAAAGGSLPGADLSAVNLAAPVADGDRIDIPMHGGVMTGSASVDRGVDLNSATVEELQTLTGVGPVLAERIFAYRQEHGPFRSVEDLLDVPGIGESKLAGLRDEVAAP